MGTDEREECLTNFELRTKLAVIEERISNLKERLNRDEVFNQRALTTAVKESEDRTKVAADELARRLHELNGETGRMATLHAAMVTRELFDARIAEAFQRYSQLDEKLNEQIAEAREQRGRLWLPMLGIGAIAAAIAAAAVALILGPR